MVWCCLGCLFSTRWFGGIAPSILWCPLLSHVASEVPVEGKERIWWSLKGFDDRPIGRNPTNLTAREAERNGLVCLGKEEVALVIIWPASATIFKLQKWTLPQFRIHWSILSSSQNGWERAGEPGWEPREAGLQQPQPRSALGTMALTLPPAQWQPLWTPRYGWILDITTTLKNVYTLPASLI